MFSSARGSAIKENAERLPDNTISRIAEHKYERIQL